MFTLSIDNNLTIADVFDTDVYIDPSVTTYPITENEKDMIEVSGQMALWQYKDGQVVESEFAPQIYKNEYNAKQKQLRLQAYEQESDPIFFKWQRGEATEQQWLDAVAQVSLQFPYQE